MTKAPTTAAMLAIAILMSPMPSFAQGTGGSAAGSPGAGAAGSPSSGAAASSSTGAAGAPSPGLAGAGTSDVSGVAPGPGNANGLNNSGRDPSGVGNSLQVATPPPSGTTSAGTANSSGSTANTGAGATTGAARPAPGGVSAPGPSTRGDAAIDAEDKAIDRKLKSICRGC